MTLNDLLTPERVFVGVHATNKKQALGKIADLAAKVLHLNTKNVLDGLVEREMLSSTGVGNGVAIPHARLDELDEIKGLFIRFDTPVEFDAIDDVRVDLVFVLLAPPDAGVDHLKALAQVSRRLRLTDMQDRLRLAPNADSCRIILCNDSGH